VSLLHYDETMLVSRLESVSVEGRAVFAGSCAERLLPAYRRFYMRTGIGDPEILDGAIDALWRSVEFGNVISLGDYADLAGSLVPDESTEWAQETAFAQHAAGAVAYALDCRRSGASQDAAWAARQCYESALLFVVDRDNVDLNDKVAMSQAYGDAAVQDELARQDADIAAVEGALRISDVARRLRRRSRAAATTSRWLSD
jgi:hypothetical protein